MYIEIKIIFLIFFFYHTAKRNYSDEYNGLIFWTMYMYIVYIYINTDIDMRIYYTYDNMMISIMWMQNNYSY